MARPAAILQVMIDANTSKATASIKRFDSSLGRTDAAARKATASTDRFDRATTSIGTSMRNAAKYAASAAAAYVGISQAKEAVSTTTDLAKATLTLNKNLGLSVKTASEFAAVAKARGVDTRALGQSFGTLSRQIEGAKRGTDTAVTSFKALGITVKELKRNTPEQTISDVADGMAELGAGTERTAASMTLFGRGWQTIVPILRDGSSAMQDQLDLANQYGASFSGKSVKSIEDLIASERELKIAQLGLQVQFTKEIAPALIDVLTQFARWINAIRKSKKDIAEWVTGAVAWLKKFWESARLLRDIVTGALNVIAATFKGMLSIFRPTVQAIVALLTGNFGDAWRRVKELFHNGMNAAIDVLGALLAPFKAVLQLLARTLKSIFDAAWGAVKKIVAKGADFILGTISTIIDGFAKMADAGSKLPGPFGDAFDKVQTGIEHLSDSVNHSRDRINAWADGAVKASGDMRAGMVENVTGLVASTTGGIDFMIAHTNKALKAFGVAEINWAVSSRRNNDPSSQAGQPRQTGGAIYSVPGYGSGDKVPAMLEPGEVVINRKAVAAMGGANKANRINSMIPRFAGGGEVGGMPAMIAEADRFEAKHFPYLWGGGHGGFGIQPVDCSGAVSDVLHAGGLLMGAPMVSGSLMGWGQQARGNEPLVVYANSHHTVMSLNGKTFGTSNSNPGGGAGWIEGGNGASLAPGAMRTMQVAGAVAAKVAEQILKGPAGALKSSGQGMLDKVHGAANRYIAKKMPSGSFGGGDIGEGAAGVPIKSLPASLQKYNHIWPHNPGGDAAAWAALPTMPFNKIAELAEWAGLPGVTMAQITKGESGGKPGSLEIGASGPGGSRGAGLWAITPPYANGLKYAGGSLSGDYQPEMFNPVYNAQIANAMAPSGPNANIWHGSGAVTGWDLHYTGAMKRAGGIIRKLAKGTKGNGEEPQITYTPPNVAMDAYSYTPAVVNTINKLAAAATAITTDIGHAEIMDAFSWSPAGAELSAGELAGQQGLWRSLIWNRQAQAKLLPKAIRQTKGQPKIQNPLIAMLATINDPLGIPGSILEALVGLDALTGTGTSVDTSTLDALKLAEAQDWARRYQVSQAQYGVFGAQAGGGVPAVTGSAGGANTVVGNADVQVYMLPDGNAHVRVNGQGFDTKVQSATRGYGRRVLPGARGV